MFGYWGCISAFVIGVIHNFYFLLFSFLLKHVSQQRLLVVLGHGVDKVLQAVALEDGV